MVSHFPRASRSLNLLYVLSKAPRSLTSTLTSPLCRAPLLPASSFENIPSRGLFCFKCKHSNFSNDSKGHRSHAQHQRNCTGLSKCGVKVSGLHVSGTDPLPLPRSSFLTKKRRINETDFNFAYQLDNYLDDNSHVDNFFDVNVDSDGSSHGSIDHQCP